MGAAQLLHLKPDVIVVHSGVAIRALRRLNKAIPIVMAGVDIPSWRRVERTNLRALKDALTQQRKDRNAPMATPFKEALQQHRTLRFTQWRMRADVGVPCVVFFLAMWAALSRIVALWPS